MTSKEEPAIVPYSGSDFTCVTFKPELKRFGMTRCAEDVRMDGLTSGYSRGESELIA